jgi:hypothetical protein
MKLRIKGNLLRLRVTRSELARLSAGETVEEAIHFAPEPTAVFRYSLVSSPETDQVGIRYRDGEVIVAIAPEQLRAWSEESQIGIYATLHLGPAGPLEIAVEKDFACLDGRDEDNRDAFANPLEGKAC